MWYHVLLAIHKCSKHSCVKPMVLFNPWGCKHNPRYCILICSLVHLTLDSEKLNDILVKPVANHYRYFCTVKKHYWLLARSCPWSG